VSSIDTIALALAGMMKVPVLDEIRARVTEEEYATVLIFAGAIVQTTEAAGLEARIVSEALTAAAAMYAEGLKCSASITGRGPASN